MICSMCHPHAGTNAICDTHLRAELASVDAFIPPTVEQLVEQVVPLRYRAADPARLLAELRGVDVATTGVLLYGPSGRGKTFQASLTVQAAIRTALERDPYTTNAGHFQWHNAATLFEQLRSQMRKDDATRITVSQLAKAPVLVLDDLGAERPTDWVRERLYDIVNTRYEAQRSVLVTTNLNPEQMERSLGARIAGRLIEMCRVIDIDGPQLRRPLPVQTAMTTEPRPEGAPA